MEFSKWAPPPGCEGHGDVKVFAVESKGKTTAERANVLRAWQRQGGPSTGGGPKGSVLIIGFEMFKNLATDNKPSSKKHAFQGDSLLCTVV